MVEHGNLQRAVSSLRKTLRTGTAPEAYIVTIAGRGFQFAMPVTFEAYDVTASTEVVFRYLPPEAETPPPRRRQAMLMLGFAVLLAFAFWRLAPSGRREVPFAPPPHSVAVLAIGGLRVAARTSAFSFKGSHLTTNAIGRQLGVAAILEGSVRRDGQHVQVAVQLIDARTGFQFWSRSYDRKEIADDMLQVQADIAESVSASLEVKLMDVDQAGLTVGGTHNARAFDAYLRGMNNNEELQEGNARQAIADFGEAIALDPAYARAFAGRAAAHNFLVYSGYETGAREDEQQAAAASADADRAISLAPTLAEAHRIKGLILFGALNFKASAEELERAVDLAPDDAGVEATRGKIEALLGHYQLAMTAARHAIALDPLNPNSYRNLGQALFWMRRFDEALQAFGHATALEKAPSRLNLAWTASAYIAAGDPAAAERVCVGGRTWTDNACLAMVYHALGRQAEAEAAFAALHQNFGDRGAYIYAEIYAQWGRTAEALRWLETAYALKDSGLTEMKVSPFLDSVRTVAEFGQVERRLNFPP
jgi:serine/threonine-protein kinase